MVHEYYSSELYKKNLLNSTTPYSNFKSLLDTFDALLLAWFLSGHNFDDSLIYLQIELINGNSVQFYCFVMCVAKFCQNVFDFQVK